VFKYVKQWKSLQNKIFDSNAPFHLFAGVAFCQTNHLT
jgi:hypothetical protein